MRRSPIRFLKDVNTVFNRAEEFWVLFFVLLLLGCGFFYRNSQFGQ